MCNERKHILKSLKKDSFHPKDIVFHEKATIWLAFVVVKVKDFIKRKGTGNGRPSTYEIAPLTWFFSADDSFDLAPFFNATEANT